MSRPPHPGLPHHPFLVTALGTADLSRASVRSRALVAPSRGIRIPCDMADALVARCRAVVLLDREEIAFWGPTAAQLLGLPLPRRLLDGPLHLMVPKGRPRPRRRGVRARQADVVDGELASLAGLPITAPARTYADLGVVLRLPDLVAVGDVLLADHRITVTELSGTVGRRLRYAGKVRARQGLALLSPLARSPQESRLRAHLALSGLPDPEVNAVVTDADGGFLACCDLVYRRWRVVVEYDGAVHDAPERRRSDATRRNLLREHGWHVVEIVDSDLWIPTRAVGKVARALGLRA